MFKGWRALAILGAMLLATIVPSGFASSADVNFSGQTIRIIVGFGPGGTYDAFARLVADHLGAYLPGRPTVIVDNMEGGGGRRSEVYLAAAAPKDGTVLSVVPENIAFDSLEGALPENMDATQFGYIGRLSATLDAGVTWKTSPTKTFEDAKTRETVFASSGFSDPASYIPRLMNKLLNTRFKVVQGYKGTADMAVAMERGEVEGMTVSLSLMRNLHPDWLDDHDVNILWQNSASRSPDFPDIPSVVDLATNDDQRAILRLAVSTAEVGRSLATPPGVPADIVAAYRTAFDAMVKDPDFAADAAKRKLLLNLASGDEVQAKIKATIDSPQAAINALKEIITGGG